MADEEEGGEGGAGGEDENEEEGDEKPKKKTWEEEQQEKLMKNRDKFMPWGSDPCLRMRLKLGQVPKNELFGIKGSVFPWYEKQRKVIDIQREIDRKEKRAAKELIKSNEGLLKGTIKKHKEYISNLSQRVYCRRLFEANKDPDCDETYEEYVARMEKEKRLKEKRIEAEEKLKKQEEEEVRKSEEEIENRKKRKLEGGSKGDIKVDKNALKVWPGKYPTSVTQDFVTMLKFIIEAEFETQQKEKKKRAPKPLSKKDRLVKEFGSFLDVLFTANELWKNCENKDIKSSDPKTPEASNEALNEKTASVIKEEVEEVVAAESEVAVAEAEEAPE